MKTPKQPTPEECSAGKSWSEGAWIYLACWYPQMGGYVGRCVVRTNNADPERGHSCFDAFVWHDGEFPFGDGEPREIHHCDPNQFIEFGQRIQRLQLG